MDVASVPTPQDLESLIRDKYNGDRSADTSHDIERLLSGEPLAYVIGWLPFLGLRIDLDSRPLIPRPETEWWSELLIADVQKSFGDASFSLLDLCAGSGAIGLSVLKNTVQGAVTFSELIPEHTHLIGKNIGINNLDESRATTITGDLYEGLPPHTRYDRIVTNPPYIPSARVLAKSVIDYEPATALFGGPDGLACIKKIAAQAPERLNAKGQLWMECDIENAHQAQDVLYQGGAQSVTLHNDLYGRPRLLVAYYL